MSFSHLVDGVVNWIILMGLPVVQMYHVLCGNIFLNVAAEEATGIEKVANELLLPVRYVLGGNVAKKGASDYILVSDLDYEQHFLAKTAAAVVALPVSLGLGTTLKALSYLSAETRERHSAISSSLHSVRVTSNYSYYQSLGMKLGDMDNLEFIDPPQCARRPGEENNKALEKEALKEVVKILKANNIPFWADCGTCLGAYRYGGIIPWDWDLDIAILKPDSENVRKALSALDPEKYAVQDWSGRAKPHTYLKVYIRGTASLIDIYHFEIDEKEKVVRSIFSNEETPFFPESMKIRERRYSVATPFALIFPLKQARFDGIDLPVPGRTKEYLQLRYGENIGPAKVYNPETGQYEKDLTHPYWKTAHVH